jgi:hypothetical protein
MQSASFRSSRRTGFAQGVRPRSRLHHFSGSSGPVRGALMQPCGILFSPALRAGVFSLLFFP